MPLDLGIVGLVGSAIKLSWSIYEKGFTKEKSLRLSPYSRQYVSPNPIRLAQRYVEFGDALFRLHSNLTTIASIVETANSSLQDDAINTFGPRIYDTTSLTEIIGNFRLTLEDCRQLLNDDKKFRQRDKFITNIIYNINVDPQIVHLTERLAFHSTKIGLVLDPFNIHVQTQLRDLHKEQHQDIAELLQELKQLLISGREPASDISTLHIKRDVAVPSELSERFASELQRHILSVPSIHGETSNEMQLSVKDGLEAFFAHFNSIGQDGDTKSYLRLMKSIWIMDKIRGSDDWSNIQRVNPGGLYDRCVREMDRRLRAKCSRAGRIQVAGSRLSIIMQLPEEAFTIWPSMEPIKDASHVAHLGVLLDIPILPDSKSHTLRVVRNVDGTLGVEDTTTTSTESSGTVSSERIVQKLNIELSRAYLVPIYASPGDLGASLPSCTVKLQSSRDGINGVTPEFKSTSDLFKLQHLVTGYRRNITVTSLIKGQEYPTISSSTRSRSRRTPSVLTEVGNLQLWQKAPYERSHSTRNERYDSGRSGSDASSPDPYSSSKSFSAASIISTMSGAHTQQISLGSSRMGIELTQPEPPLIVLFLRQPDTAQLSFLVIELDERTKIEPNSCDCRSTKKACAISVLERSGTPLLARRFYASNGLNSWNLAAIGEHWSSSDSKSVQVQNMYWLRVAFKSESERVKFNSNVTDLVRIFAGRMEDYQKDLKLVKGTHIISQAG
ncbi:Nn.00g008740.m01.CDS01 [Neocucurbitaria sp. VM-36]